MHESNLIKDLLNKVAKQLALDDVSRVSKIVVALSLFGGIKRDRFKEHFYQFIKNTPWKDVKLEIKETEIGAPLSFDSYELS
ncbi:MAG TPA: hypothetical protein ENH41_01480 [Candidatus Omnitrophica bacterium]|nr:hypothetical protein [Candidatus Omnitrophota bacterium]